jgi:hypothetical protein
MILTDTREQARIDVVEIVAEIKLNDFQPPALVILKRPFCASL